MNIATASIAILDLFFKFHSLCRAAMERWVLRRSWMVEGIMS